MENPAPGTPIEPYAANEKIAPSGLGTGPANVSMNLRFSKVIGIGPKMESGEDGRRPGGGGGGWRPGARGTGGGLSGSRGGPGRLDQGCPAQIQPDVLGVGHEIFNHENLGTPNGALSAPTFFGKSQTLAGGFFASPTAGNRNISLQATFSF